MALVNENMQGLVLFSHINRQGSLTAAAQLLGMSRSSVSKQLAALEKKIGSRLFNRTTRKIALTEVGRQVLKEAHKVELALQTIEHISEDSQSIVAGDLNISCASAQGRVHLVPLLTRFLSLYPKVNVNLQLEDRFIDMVAENIDVSIRVGYLPDSSLIARKLGDLSGVLCATPEYLTGAPALKTPSDLLHHRCLFYRNKKLAMNSWTFFSEQRGEETVVVSGPLSINDPGVLISAALEHAGVLLTDKSLLGDTMEEGALIPVLPEYQSIGNLPIYIVYPRRELLPAKTKALVDFLLKEMPNLLRGE
ncbi:LysR family transcriptional regulator [Shewanella woodyi]|uniref:Transcriptional regulator, LysR family n=1 Tax=Shewanella woodyi (strain ATCC 51908 / MS32) TaxID=392500 RepID=B1KKM0_SHEWM|nr:LysR family transcriptional regulator [Shewanella woodyi]ACA87237.1 transcriptional regulator, LysR family [Shewanella woodyi ATCC 51908]